MSAPLRFHPAARRPRLALLVLVGLGFLGGAAWAVLPEPAVVLSLALVMGVSLLPFYAPTDYLFDEEGVEVARAGRRRRHPWAGFGSFQVQRNGILLLPDMPGLNSQPNAAPGGGSRPGAAPSLRALRRAVFLPMDAELQARALPLLEGRLPGR